MWHTGTGLFLTKMFLLNSSFFPQMSLLPSLSAFLWGPSTFSAIYFTEKLFVYWLCFYNRIYLEFLPKLE